MSDTIVGAMSELPGKVVDTVVLNIDYEIIDHFSNYLYGSPNKAIEELVANGFDAFATWVHVFLPTEYTPEKVVVWDNGESMDLDGLKGLWNIASSPKQKYKDRIARGPNGEERKLIGKFGIGKLASYTVGDGIVHLCKTGERFLLVGIDYEAVTTSLKDKKKGSEKEKNDEKYRSDILELTATEARAFVDSLFNKKPPRFEELYDDYSWTLAVISKLKNPDVLHLGRLSWVLGNGMPLRPDFQIWVDDELVTSKLARVGAVAEWDFGSKDIKTAVSKAWEDAVKAGTVSGTISFGTRIGLNPGKPTLEVPYVELPNLGQVHGEFKLYGESLERYRAAEQGRSYGFFIMVRGRLINPTNDKMFLNEPSFGTFYRSQYVLYVDALDVDLLADRERIRSDTARVKELTIIQQAIYGITRAKQQELAAASAAAALPSQRLPTFSREYYIEPLTALWMNRGPDRELEFELNNPEVVRTPMSKDAPMAELSADGKGFAVNSRHPFYLALEGQFGTNKVGQEILREYEQIAIAEQLFIGFLYELGIPEDKVSAIEEFRDRQFRMIAESNRESLETLATELRNASFKSGTVFENAIVKVLRAMGFIARRNGKSGQEDILLVAPAGRASYQWVFEAKGKASGSINNDEAELDGAAAHRDAVDASHVVVVAREFSGFKTKEDPQILKQCRAVGGVSIMEVEALIEMMMVMNKYFYPLDTVQEVFTAVEAPEAKLERIRKLDRPLDTFDFGSLLKEIWQRQEQQTKGRDVPYLNLIYEVYDGILTEDELERSLAALQALAYPLIQLETNRQRVALRQSPERIVDLINYKLELDKPKL
jgi:hypothetical protein